MDRQAQTCCFTGHRAAKLPWGTNEQDPACIALKARIAQELEALVGRGYRYFICGMANGCDMYFGEAVLALAERCPEVKLEAAVPCDTQADGWKKELRARYDRLLAAAETVTYVQHGYSRGCMMRRNRYMVERSSLLLACYDGHPGGTMNTILLADRAGLEIITIELSE